MWVREEWRGAKREAKRKKTLWLALILFSLQFTHYSTPCERAKKSPLGEPRRVRARTFRCMINSTRAPSSNSNFPMRKHSKMTHLSSISRFLPISRNSQKIDVYIAPCTMQVVRKRRYFVADTFISHLSLLTSQSICNFQPYFVGGKMGEPSAKKPKLEGDQLPEHLNAFQG